MSEWDPSLYDRKHGFVARHGASLIDLLAPRRGERILDAGCGTGHLTSQIAASGAKVVGIDRSPEMIAAARKHYSAAAFMIADIRTFQSRTKFDAVFSNAALHWVRPPESAVRQIAKLLKIGGRFVAEFGGRGNVARILAAVRSLVTGRAEAAMPEWYFPGVAEYAQLLEASDLEPASIELFDRPTPLEGDDGLRNWLRMFAGGVLTALPRSRHKRFYDDLENSLRGELYLDGVWHADYRRIRVIARRR